MLKKLLLALTLISSVIGFTLAPAGAQDYTSQGSATFSNSAPGPGDTFTVSGKTTPDTVVTVTIEGTSTASQTNGAAVLGKTTLGTTTSDGDGNFSVTVTVPASATGDMVLNVVAGGQVIASSNLSMGGSVGGGAASGGGAAQTPTSDLPVTGSSASLILVLSVLLLGAGGVLLVVSRRATN